MYFYLCRMAATPERVLSPQLVALISQVELTRSNWWQSALRETVLLAVWLSDSPADRAAIAATTRDTHGLRVEPGELEEQITALADAGELIDVGGGLFKVSEARALQLVARIEDHERTDEQAREQFVSVLSQHAPDADQDSSWTVFNEALLVPLVHQLGARTHHFLQGRPFDLKSSTLMHAFLKRFPARVREQVEEAVLSFLDPASPVVRAYIVDRLTTYSFVQACRWPRELLDEVLKLGAETPTFITFLDTNLLFSILDLHENPSNEAARALKELQGQLAGLVDLKLYVTADTIKEARESLLRTEQRMRGVVLTPEVVRGTSMTRFSGLARRFIDQAATSAGIRRPEEYFGQYADNLLAFARDHGVELFNADLGPLHVDQRVIDDIDLATQVEKKRRSRMRKGRTFPEKTFEQLQHDVVLWHFVAQKRTAYVESPLQARYWIVTVDYGLLGFDAHKSQTASVRRRTPVCLHPTALVQMLRFWVPRGEALDSAVVRTLRLPFLTMDFDSDLERATTRILQTIARFEHAEALTEETIASLVTNDELRRRMGPDSTPEQREAALQAAFLSEEEKLRSQISAASAEVDDARALATTRGRAIADLENQLRGVQLEVQAIRDAAATTEEAPSETPGSLLLVVLTVLGTAVVVFLPGAALTWVLLRALPPSLSIVTITVSVLVGVALVARLSVLFVDRIGTNGDRRIAGSLTRFHKAWWILIIAGLFIGVAAPLLVDSLKARPTSTPGPEPRSSSEPSEPAVPTGRPS